MGNAIFTREYNGKKAKDQEKPHESHGKIWVGWYLVMKVWGTQKSEPIKIGKHFVPFLAITEKGKIEGKLT